MAQTGKYRAITSNAALDRPEVIVRPDLDRLSELGISTAALAETLRQAGFPVHTAGDCEGVGYIEGAMAECFKEGVEALIESSPSIEEIDAYLERYASMAQQPVVVH